MEEGSVSVLEMTVMKKSHDPKQEEYEVLVNILLIS
jgi:hypothetical protein